MFGLPIAPNQTSAPSPENPKVRSTPGTSSEGMFSVRFLKWPVPTCVHQRSSSPARSDRNTTNRPSGEMSARASVPSQSVKVENWAAAKGSAATSARVACQSPTPAPIIKAPASATRDHGRGRVGDPRGLSTGPSPQISSISSLASPMSLSRALGSFARHRRRSRRSCSGTVAGNADQSGSRSRIFAIESEAVSPPNARWRESSS